MTEFPRMAMYMSMVRNQLLTTMKWNKVTIPLLNELKFIK
eukprot:CAMPEP_0185617186 /NCGR_PEP_ID=MMETSP0436-20130131/42656_1 /TAXON_ID=626734 ORGANISM="Favella taraikaensis, Strain Fe Narragansett Bay" /NCGR_SAMPLE_ID=MMETSP0436 /ASSEMBLY_ACC=CAM_ASM_000390 /LENGTH=39 /DNA_ID= /DNA_START= /DNA_END= /DNA_ORIENTATION=